MDTELLRTFLEVHRVRNFGRAAANLCVTPSAVSARIRQLERSLGVTLFVRQHQGVSLTPAGERLLRHAKGIMGAWERAYEDLALDQSHERRLVIAGVNSFWDIFLQGWLNRVYAEHRNLGLRAEASTARRISQKLAAGLIDLGFLFEPPQLPDLIVRELMSVPLVLVSSRPDVAVEEALAENYIRVEWGTSFTSLHESHFPHRPIAPVRVNMGRIACELMRSCGGSAYLPEALVARDLEQGVLYRVDEAPVIGMLAYAAYPARGEHRKLIDTLLESVGER